MSDYAIIEASGKQYRVSAGETITTEIVSGLSVGDEITFDRVLLVKQDETISVGAPYIESGNVTAEVEAIERTKKMIIYKYKPKKRYRRKAGHRQHYMVSRIKEISA